MAAAEINKGCAWRFDVAPVDRLDFCFRPLASKVRAPMAIGSSASVSNRR
jgi:hypothetical protein